MKRIQESILIGAPRDVAWRTFTDLTCWADWNSVLTDVQPGPDAAIAGGGFSCGLRPFGFAVPFAVRVEVAEAPVRLRWSAARWGVHGSHWFHFTETPDGTLCKSLEDLSGPAVTLAGPLFPLWRFRELTRRFLRDLKDGAERRAAGG